MESPSGSDSPTGAPGRAGRAGEGYRVERPCPSGPPDWPLPPAERPPGPDRTPRSPSVSGVGGEGGPNPAAELGDGEQTCSFPGRPPRQDPEGTRGAALRWALTRVWCRLRPAMYFSRAAADRASLKRAGVRPGRAHAVAVRRLVPVVAAGAVHGSGGPKSRPSILRGSAAASPPPGPWPSPWWTGQSPWPAQSQSPLAAGLRAACMARRRPAGLALGCGPAARCRRTAGGGPPGGQGGAARGGAQGVLAVEETGRGRNRREGEKGKGGGKRNKVQKVVLPFGTRGCRRGQK